MTPAIGIIKAAATAAATAATAATAAAATAAIATAQESIGAAAAISV